jgi:hypothetical protein
MATKAPEVRVTDSKARLTLPKAFANSTLLLEVRSDVEIVIRKAQVVPLAPGGELQPDSSPAPLSAADWELFMSVLDNPPPLPDKLKEEIARQKKRLKREAGRR